MNFIDPETGADHEQAKIMIEEQRQLVQNWINQGINLKTIAYVLGTSLIGFVAQIGAPREKVERFRNEILKWIVSTDD